MTNSTASSFDTLPAAALIKLPKVKTLTGLSKAATYARAKLGTFPAPVKLSAGGRSSAWRVGSIRQWLADPAGYRAANDEVAI